MHTWKHLYIFIEHVPHWLCLIAIWSVATKKGRGSQSFDPVFLKFCKYETKKSRSRSRISKCRPPVTLWVSALHLVSYRGTLRLPWWFSEYYPFVSGLCNSVPRDMLISSDLRPGLPDIFLEVRKLEAFIAPLSRFPDIQRQLCCTLYVRVNLFLSNRWCFVEDFEVIWFNQYRILQIYGRFSCPFLLYVRFFCAWFHNDHFPHLKNSAQRAHRLCVFKFRFWSTSFLEPF